MASVKEGDYVEIVRRDATEEELKAGTYYPHYGGMAGRILKLYNELEAAVEVEHTLLPKPIRQRHDDIRNQMKTKWLDGLSEEGRGKLTEREKDFVLRYVVLVRPADLKKAVAPADAQRSLTDDSAQAPPVPRKTLEQIEADELAELTRRAAVIKPEPTGA